MKKPSIDMRIGYALGNLVAWCFAGDPVGGSLTSLLFLGVCFIFDLPV
jgi:hypothetical protein